MCHHAISLAFLLCLILTITKGDVCANLTCPAPLEENLDSFIGSSPPLYELVLSAGIYIPGEPLKVRLQMTNFIEYDAYALFGLSWYKIEVFDNITGEPASGSFQKPPLLKEASLCSNNETVVYKTCRPSVLDFPVTYKWEPSKKSVNPICFKTTIHQYGSSNCEVFTTCIPSNQELNTTPDPPTDGNIIIIGGTLPTPPSQEQIDKCMSRWTCENAKLKDFCGSNNKTYPSRCHWRRDKCIHKADWTITKGACKLPPPPTTPPPPTPTCRNKYNKNPVPGLFPECTCIGTYKPVECYRDRYTGELSCWCIKQTGSHGVRDSSSFELECLNLS